MESVVDIMKSNNALWREEWPFEPVLSLRWDWDEDSSSKDTPSSEIEDIEKEGYHGKS